MNKIWIAVIFGGLTLASAAIWYVTGSDFWGGIFGNMLVGAVTLLFIDYLLDASMERQRKPARKAAIRAASEVHGQAIRLIFNLYGASVLTGRLSSDEHQAFARDRLDERMVPVLAKTPLRDIAFISPNKPAIIYMFEDAVILQRKVEVTLAAHGQYLSPAIAAALFELSRADLISFTTTCVPLSAIPEFFSADIFTQYFASLKSLTDALVDAEPALKTRLVPRGAMEMLSQPGVHGMNAGKPQ